jgi:hypothetical protein
MAKASDDYLYHKLWVLTEVLYRLLPEASWPSFNNEGLTNIRREFAALASNIRICPTTYRFSADLAGISPLRKQPFFASLTTQ